MSILKILRNISAVLVLGIVSVPVQATTLIDFTSDDSTFTWFGTSVGCSGGCTLGYTINVTSSISVDALGVFDAGGDGLNNLHQVGLWTNGGTLLASTSVGPSSTITEASASSAGDFVYSSISAQILGIGTYVVGALYSPGDADHVVFDAGGIFSNSASASYGDLRFTNSGVFQRPTNSSSSADKYFGPAIRLSAIPIPASLSLLGLGMFAIGFVGRQRRKS